jgi:hypothetical protein
MLRLRSLVLSALVLGGAALPAAAADVATDPVKAALSPAMTATLDRDNRCADAKSAATKLAAALDDSDLAAASIIALDKCLRLPRIGGTWNSYKDYVLVAEGASALALARSSGNLKAFDRAVLYASHVTGYAAGSDSGHVLVTNLERGGSVDSAHEGGPTDNSSGAVRYIPVTSSGPVGTNPSEFGALATAIGRAASSERAAAEAKK